MRPRNKWRREPGSETARTGRREWPPTVVADAVSQSDKLLNQLLPGQR